MSNNLGLVGWNNKGFREMGIGMLGDPSTTLHRKFRWFIDAWERHGKAIWKDLRISLEHKPDKSTSSLLIQSRFDKEVDAIRCKDTWAYLCDGYATIKLIDGGGTPIEIWDYDILTTLQSRIMMDEDTYVVETALKFVDVYRTILV